MVEVDENGKPREPAPKNEEKKEEKKEEEQK